MIIYKKGPFRIGDLYFDEPWNGNQREVDIIRLNQTAEPVHGFECKPFYTICTDLSVSEDVLSANLDRDTRRTIRQSIVRDQLTTNIWQECGEELIAPFIKFYDKFAQSKNLPKSNRDKLVSLAASSALALTCASGKDGHPLVWHAYICKSGRARLLYSASHQRNCAESEDRQRIGRANRVLHWNDILAFKERSFTTYDMGGWHEGQDPDKLRINKFKEEFGGLIVKNYNCTAGCTKVGHIVLWFRKALKYRLPNTQSAYRH